MAFYLNLTFLLLIFSFLNSLGQTFTNYTTADGLVDNNVLCATSQGSGVMWFGTQNGKVCQMTAAALIVNADLKIIKLFINQKL